MNILYIPQGRAREYADLACNPYNGCTHGCEYCYGKRYKQEAYYQDAAPKRDVIAKLRKDVSRLNGHTPEILLSFQGDVYQHAEVELGVTRQALELFIAHNLPFTILTKGGKRAVRDFDLLERYDKARFGTSLVFDNDESAAEWEPNAASISERIAVLRAAKIRGIPTWVSMEPVIYPGQALNVVEMLHDVVDHWKVGKLNYHKAAHGVDWLKFREDITEQLERYGASYYLKRSLTELR
jgi:DNA repair photolyase